MKSKLNLPGPACRAWGVALVVVTCAGAAPAEAASEAASPGYYRVDLVFQVSPGKGLTVQLGHENDQETYRAFTADGKVIEQSVNSRVEHQCLRFALNREGWLSMLRSFCQANLGRSCDPPEIQAEREGPDQWKLTYPVWARGSSPQDLDRLRQVMGDARALSHLDAQQQARIQAALKQMPRGSDLQQSNADLAQRLDVIAASKSGPEAEILHEQARRLRAGTAGGETGQQVERWTRVGNSCPAQSGNVAPSSPSGPAPQAPGNLAPTLSNFNRN